MTEDLRTIQVGAATVTIINVGDVQEDLNNWFALSEAERAHHADLLAKPARLPIQCIHIAMPGVSVLVDAGLYDYPPDAPQLIPGYQPPLDLFAGLAQRQIKLDEIQQVIITHAHGDHFDAESLAAIAGSAPLVVTEEVMGKLPEALKAQATMLKNGDSGTIDGIPVTAVPAYNITPDRLDKHPQGVGNGYVLSFGDKRVYVAGDTEDTPEMRALTGIDVAFLPMNLPYTMDVEQAADAVKAFKPKIVYPYHYRSSDIEKFKELVGAAAEVRLVDWYANAAGG